jgi:hypothetical protein
MPRRWPTALAEKIAAHTLADEGSGGRAFGAGEVRAEARCMDELRNGMREVEKKAKEVVLEQEEDEEEEEEAKERMNTCTFHLLSSRTV